MPTSRLVSNITGMQVQRNKAIVGRNAFAHEAGIHQDGMLKERTTYEIMRPEDVGFTQDRPGARQAQRPGRAGRPGQGAGLPPHAASSCRRVFDEFKKLADKKKEIYDADIAALIEKQMHDRRRRVEARRATKCTPTGRRAADGHASRSTAAANELTQRRPAATARSTRCSARSKRSPASRSSCRDFRVHSVTRGKDAQGEVDDRSRAQRPASTAAAASRPTPSKPPRSRSSTR